jgi:hypothetical protein
MTTNRVDRLTHSDTQAKDARPGDRTPIGDTAKRAAVATLVVIAVVAAALALWKLKLILALVFLGITIAAAMRSGVDRLAASTSPAASGRCSTSSRSSGSSRCSSGLPSHVP